MDKILVVEDASDFQLLIKAALAPHYPLTVVATIQDARLQMAKTNFTLLILDVNLPDGDGFKYCAEIREHETTRWLPVIFLTGRSELEDRLTGFSRGADDYIVKPFEHLELRARVEARLVRERTPKTQDDIFVRGPIRLKVGAGRAFVVDAKEGSQELGLTPIEFKILYFLARNESRVISREELLATVWGRKTHVFGRATDKHVSSLRQKLGAFAGCIETVSREGYRFSLNPIAG